MSTSVKYLLLIFLNLALWTGSAQAQFGQQSGTPQTPAQQQPAAPAANETASTPSVGQYPPNPLPFFRGNPAQPNQPMAQGFYLSLWKFGFIIAFFFVWVSTSYWTNKDSDVLGVRHDFWNSVMLLAGMAGFLSALTMPNFWVGFLVLAICYGVPTGMYVKERNRRVPDSGKVLTPDHLQGVLARVLGKFGIHTGGKTGGTSFSGPAIQFIGKSGVDRDETRSKQVESSRGYLAAKELVYDAIMRRGTDIHIEPKEEQVSIRVRIDGVMYPTEPFDRPTGEAVVNIFKVLGAMDITEKRRPQDGSFRALLDGREVDFRVATQGTRHGEKMSLRILDQSNSVASVKGLGFRKQLEDQLLEIIHQPHGLFICCGPTGAGKSTTLYAALNSIDSFQRNIITVEDPVEYKMENVNQIEINTKAGQSFGTALRSILRQDPDVVMVGEIRDGETANIACQAANTGHMVFSTIHANDTITALYRFIELGVEPFMVSNSISGILAQRLARRLCNDCKIAYKPATDLLKKEGLPPDKVSQFFRAPTERDRDMPCSSCGGLGYKGRIGVFELLKINDRIRDLIRDKASVNEIKAEARKNGMLYMREEGMRLVVRGVTSHDELMRVVH